MVGMCNEDTSSITHHENVNADASMQEPIIPAHPHSGQEKIPLAQPNVRAHNFVCDQILFQSNAISFSRNTNKSLESTHLVKLLLHSQWP